MTTNCWLMELIVSCDGSQTLLILHCDVQVCEECREEFCTGTCIIFQYDSYQRLVQDPGDEEAADLAAETARKKKNKNQTKTAKKKKK